MQKAETKQRHFVFLNWLTPGGQQLNINFSKAECLQFCRDVIDWKLQNLSDVGQTFNVSDVRQNFNIDFSESSAYVTFSFSTDDFSF